MSKQLLAFGMSIALLAPLAAQAGPAEDFDQAYAEATRTQGEAPGFQWTTTSATLTAAKAEAEKGNYDKAQSMANEAKAMAEASIEQREDGKEGWRQVAIGH